MLSLERDCCWTKTTSAPPNYYHTIPAFSPGGFDSMVDDVDKKVFRSTKNVLPNLKKFLPATMPLKKAELVQQVPRTVIVAEEILPCDEEIDDVLPQATIKVLEEFFDGVDDNVDVRQEVKNYDCSIESTLDIDDWCSGG